MEAAIMNAVGTIGVICLAGAAFGMIRDYVRQF
jgi:hypothetical protein